MTHNNRQLNNARRGGFSLIELLVVIAVIGILAGLLVPSFSAARIQAKKVKVITLISVLDAGLQQFKSETRLGRDYPPSFWRMNIQAEGNPYTNIPGASPDLVSPVSTTASGATTLVWALAGPVLQGSAGFQVDPTSHPNGLADLYNPANDNRTYGPYIDVTDVDVKPIDLTSSGEADNKLPVFVDVFNNPILYFKPTGGAYFYKNNETFLTGFSNDTEFREKIRDDRQAQMFSAAASAGPYNSDSFLLLSAGPDMSFAEKVGTNIEKWSDNIANFPIK